MDPLSLSSVGHGASRTPTAAVGLGKKRCIHSTHTWQLCAGFWTPKGRFDPWLQKGIPGLGWEAGRVQAVGGD